MLLSSLIAAGSSNLHREAIDWHNRVITNGGRVSSSTLKAVSNFCRRIDAAGIRDRFLRLNLICGSNLAAAAVPLFRGESRTATQYGQAADINTGPFVSADYSEATGLNSAYPKYFDITLNIASLYLFGADSSNVHASVYNIDSTSGAVFGGADEYDEDNYVGCILDPTNSMANQPFFSSSGYITDGWAYGAFGAGGPGFWIGEVGSGPTGYLTQNDTDVKAGQSFSLSSYSADNITPLIFAGAASNYAGNGFAPTDYYYGAGHVASYSVGKAFTSNGQRTAFYNAMQAFQTALGRAV